MRRYKRRVAIIDNSEKRIEAFAAHFCSTVHRDLAITKAVKKVMPQHSSSRQDSVFNIIRDMLDKKRQAEGNNDIFDAIMDSINLAEVRPVVWSKTVKRWRRM